MQSNLQHWLHGEMLWLLSHIGLRWRVKVTNVYSLYTSDDQEDARVTIWTGYESI